jgi:hypothetical protein
MTCSESWQCMRRPLFSGAFVRFSPLSLSHQHYCEPLAMRGDGQAHVRFMFDYEGRLLQANHRAIKHCQQQLAAEEELTMWSLFKLGQYASKYGPLYTVS